MATTTQTRYTPEDLLKITDRPMPDLIDGQLVEREMGQEADAIAARILRRVGNYVDEHGLGLVNGAQGSYQIFPDDPNKVRIPDVSFTRRSRLAGGRPAQGHSRVAPDLVIEVVSPNDTVAELKRKLRDFQRAGVPLIWVVDPENQEVEVLRGDGSRQLLEYAEEIDGESVLPGFRCPVAWLFT